MVANLQLRRAAKLGLVREIVDLRIEIRNAARLKVHRTEERWISRRPLGGRPHLSLMAGRTGKRRDEQQRAHAQSILRACAGSSREARIAGQTDAAKPANTKTAITAA